MLGCTYGTRTTVCSEGARAMPGVRWEGAKQVSVLCTSVCLCKNLEQQMDTDPQKWLYHHVCTTPLVLLALELVQVRDI